MRIYPLLALVLLAGCASQNAWTPAPSNSIPGEVVMEGLEGTLTLRVGSNVAWRIDSYSNWLTVSPASGVGPKVVQLRADFGGEIQSQAEYSGSLGISGDIEAIVAVRLPLVRVVGSVTDGSLTSATSLTQINSQGLRSDTPSKASAKPTEILVKYRRDLRSVALPQGSRVLSHDQISRLTKLQSANPQALLQRLRLDPSVEWAELNGTVSAQGEPTDQFYPRQWYLRSTGARFTYLQSYPNPITVAVVDTGVRYDHPDLAGRLWLPGEGAYDFVGDAAPPADPEKPYDPCADPAPGNPGDTDPTDPCDRVSLNDRTDGSHGTHVTGIIAASSGSFAPACPTCTDSGIVGMAYNAPIKVLPLRVLGSNGSGTFEDVALAVRYAAGIPVQKAGQTLQNPQPAQVINLSVGSEAYSNVMCEAVADAVARGVLVVAAAGNSRNPVPGKKMYPASCPGAISVSATDSQNNLAWYSFSNDEVDIAAPGGSTLQPNGGVISTTWNYQTNSPSYTYYQGTSQATPQVSAALAMLLSAGKASSAEEAWAKLRDSATDLGPPGRDDAYGYGLLNLPAAFAWPLPKGDFLVSFVGPMTRRIPAPNGLFDTYLLPGRYTMTACRDDSGNGLCDLGEPKLERPLQVSGRNTLDLGAMRVGP